MRDIVVNCVQKFTQTGLFSQICGECGKGFYRKDHLRKHTKSHATKRLKEELSAQKAAAAAASNPNAATSKGSGVPVSNGTMAMIDTSTIKTEPTSTPNCNADDILQQVCFQRLELIMSYSMSLSNNLNFC